MRQRVEQSFAVVSTPDIPPVMDHTPLTPAQIKREKVLLEWVQKYAQKPDKLEYLR